MECLLSCLVSILIEFWPLAYLGDGQIQLVYRGILLYTALTDFSMKYLIFNSVLYCSNIGQCVCKVYTDVGGIMFGSLGEFSTGEYA